MVAEIYHGDHFAVEIESLCCAPETNSVVGRWYFQKKMLPRYRETPWVQLALYFFQSLPVLEPLPCLRMGHHKNRRG